MPKPRVFQVVVLALVAISCAPGAAIASLSPESTLAARPSAAPPPSPIVPEGFTAHAGARVDVYAAPEIPQGDVERVLSVADAVTPRIEETYGITLSRRPTIYLFANEEQYRFALFVHWHLGAEAAVMTARNPAYELPNVSLAIEWSKTKDFNQLTVIPHELTHLFITEYGRARVPRWLNEGLARLSELMLDGTTWRAAAIKYTAASMAATNTLYPLSGLLSPAFVSTRDSVEIDGAYAEAAQAADFVRAELGQVGIQRLLRAIGQGATFEVAYLAVTGRKQYEFEETFPQSARGLASEPGIATTADAPEGAGPFVIVYGFPISTPISIAIAGGGRSSTASGSTTRFGTFSNRLDVLPSGSFTLTATSGTTSASTTVRVAR
jgi:hypothetical protein